MKTILRPASLLAPLLLALPAAATGGSVFADQAAFGPGATVEDFEGLLGAALPAPFPMGPPLSYAPLGFDFGSGVAIFDAYMPDGLGLWDFAYPDNFYGWSLSLGGGTIDTTTTLPSGTGFLSYIDASFSTPSKQLVYRFQDPIQRVGAFVEDSSCPFPICIPAQTGVVEFEAFDAAFVSLGTVTVTTDGVATDGALDTWIGIETTGAPIRYLGVRGSSMAMDDLTFEKVSAFQTLGGGAPGTSGTPALAGLGTMAPLSPVSLELTGAHANSSAILVFGLSALNTPFLGGTLIPNTDTLVFGLPTDATGSLSMATTWPGGVAAGVQTWYQFWVADPGSPYGFSASNGLVGTTP